MWLLGDRASRDEGDTGEGARCLLLGDSSLVRLFSSSLLGATLLLKGDGMLDLAMAPLFLPDDGAAVVLLGWEPFTRAGSGSVPGATYRAGPSLRLLSASL